MTERDSRRYAELYRAYYESIAPFVKAKASIYGMVLPEYYVLRDATQLTSVKYTFSPEQTRTLALLDQTIEQIRQRFEQDVKPLLTSPAAD